MIARRKRRSSPDLTAVLSTETRQEEQRQDLERKLIDGQIRDVLALGGVERSKSCCRGSWCVTVTATVTRVTHTMLPTYHPLTMGPHDCCVRVLLLVGRYKKFQYLLVMRALRLYTHPDKEKNFQLNQKAEGIVSAQ